jgi:tripartite ATP-independent transporter DctM subunit
MADLISSSGLARDLYKFASNLLGHIRGGLAIATTFSCAVFGGLSGSAIADAAVFSGVCMPEMRRYGYSEELGAGTIGVGATVAILIPPSIPMVIYGFYTGQSVGKLLIAGAIPGIIVAIFLALAVYVWVAIKPSHGPKGFRPSSAELLTSLLRTWPSILLILLVLIALYAGIATPTEIAALGAFMAGVIGFAMGRFKSWGALIEPLKRSIRTSTMVFPIFLGANIFGNFMAYSQVPQHIAEAVAAMNLNRWVIMTGIIAAYFLVSMFMDEIPLLLLTLQVFFPVIVSLGFDPIWFGVMCMMMVSMGLVFPPVGMVAFIVSATAKVDLMKVYKGTSILMIAIVLTTILIMIFPQIALWLPSTMR